MHKKLTLLIAAGALGTAVAGCGTSTAPGIQLAPSSGATAPAATSATGATGAAGATGTTATSTTATVPTPTTGPLSKPPTTSKPTGPAPAKLVIKNLVTGTGATAKAGDTITVNYVGQIYKSGKVFQSSFTDGQGTLSTPLSTGSIIAGWVKGVPGMKVGGRRELIIPASLAYGSSPPSGSGIPKNAPLIFYIDLLKVSK